MKRQAIISSVQVRKRGYIIGGMYPFPLQKRKESPEKRTHAMLLNSCFSSQQHNNKKKRKKDNIREKSNFGENDLFFWRFPRRSQGPTRTFRDNQHGAFLAPTSKRLMQREEGREKKNAEKRVKEGRGR